MKLLLNLTDKFVDWLLTILIKYKNKRKLSELKQRDPFIYN